MIAPIGVCSLALFGIGGPRVPGQAELSMGFVPLIMCKVVG